MVDLAAPQPGDIMADLGSGDGRIAIAFAKAGIEAHGYEVDIEMITSSRQLITQEQLDSLVTIHNQDFWNVDLSNYTIITIYPMPDVMDILEEKFQKELKQGTKVLLNYYPFNSKEPSQVKDHIYFYIF